jgi:NAD(P)H-dependent FMN reductase
VSESPRGAPPRPLRILALSGSLRAGSSNTALLRAAAALAPAEVEIRVYGGMGDLPHFNPDLEGHEPAAVKELWKLVAEADGFLISSPEYAHGVPGVLKNALDWLVSHEQFAGKPVAFLNPTPRGTYAQAALTEILTTMAARIVPEASFALSPHEKRLDEAGILARPDVVAPLRAALASFVRVLASRRADAAP